MSTLRPNQILGPVSFLNLAPLVLFTTDEQFKGDLKTCMV